MTSHSVLTSTILTSALVFVTILPAAAETHPGALLTKRPTPIGDAVAAYATLQAATAFTQAPPVRVGSGRRAPRLLPVLIGAGIGFGLGASLGYRVSEGDSPGIDAMKVGLGMAALGAGIGYVISSR